MGSPENEEGRYDNEGPQHLVTWTEGRWLGDTPVTQGLWKAVTGKNPSYFQSGKQSTEDRPVEKVNWAECVTLCEAIGMRLPSEAEWEYACRGGTTTGTWVGDLVVVGDNNAPALDPIAWYGGNCGVDFDLEETGYDVTRWRNKQSEFARGGTRGVRQKKPNPLGLYDMLGNVDEWCYDADHKYTNDGQENPAPVSPLESVGACRIIRGGSWHGFAKFVRAAYRRFADLPGLRYYFLGFRLARDADPDKSKKGSA
jgi:formylglycine-generating enzyme required for sulfatase activity